jgi:hypothetical protein
MKTIAANDHSARLRFHAERMRGMTHEQTSYAFHYFLGALESMCEPKSCINPGPNREALVLALERAINSQTGT